MSEPALTIVVSIITHGLLYVLGYWKGRVGR